MSDERSNLLELASRLLGHGHHDNRFSERKHPVIPGNEPVYLPTKLFDFLGGLVGAIMFQTVLDFAQESLKQLRNQDTGGVLAHLVVRKGKGSWWRVFFVTTIWNEPFAALREPVVHLLHALHQLQRLFRTAHHDVLFDAVMEGAE
jgi:hypothetical protein